MYLTWLDSNSWLIELSGKFILLDPWLVDSLVFGNLPWLFKGSRTQSRDFPPVIDLILLSQGLEDHAHPPTLKQLNRNIPVVASPNAAKVVQALGYTQITPLAHGETFTLDGTLEIKAVPGSPIGPTLVENGYLLKALTTHTTLYYEPHGYHAPSLQQETPIDVVITPIVDLALPLVGPIIKGSDSALKLAKTLKPQVMLPTAAGGDVQFEGLLMAFLREVGTLAEFQQKLAEKGLSTQVLNPKPGERFEVPLMQQINP